MAPSPEVNGNIQAAEPVDADEAAPEGQVKEGADVPFSWLDPHPIFVIILVGPEEQPFGIQKDFLCATSTYFREHFARNNQEQIEHVVNLPKTPVEVFAHCQNFLYTGEVFPKLDSLPSYEVLVGVWKLGHELGIDGLCNKTLEAMSECRRITQHIPATPLLVQVWKDTPEGSSIRKLLLEWAAEYMRSSSSRAEFARSLPQEVLSELVVAMSSLEPPAAAPGPLLSPINGATAFTQHHQKNVHYLEDNDIEEVPASRPKKQRHSDLLPNGYAAGTATKSAAAKKPRASLSAAKSGPKRRYNASVTTDQPYTTDRKLNFCADLLSRMLSGPGFWTRLVGPFREPVDPATDGVPDYLERIKRPMDLSTMKAKMDRKEYANEEEFLADMHQIFTNCYTYWTKKDPMWGACEKLEKTFEEKYAQMNKWIAKMEGVETP